VPTTGLRTLPWKTANAKDTSNMDLLRIVTAGSVDDGKSTLIGRLLLDSKALDDDVLSAVRDASRRSQSDSINLALVTDGLRAEREQGITIDVAYRYFSTSVRKFILADTPGHVGTIPPSFSHSLPARHRSHRRLHKQDGSRGARPTSV